MFAFEIPNQRFSLPAGADIARYRFVAVTAYSEGTIATSGTANPILGVSMNEAKAGQVLEIADGIVMVEAGDVVPAGIAVTCDAEGRAVIDAERKDIAVALTSATAAGDIITVKL